MRTGLIYIAWFPNGKGYCGQTVEFDRRKKDHKKSADRGDHYLFQRAIRKHGWDSIVWVIWPDDVPEDQLDELEIETIAFFGLYGSGGYNMTPGGEGLEMTDEIKEKIRAANKGQTRSAEARARMSIAQRNKAPITEATRAKLRANHHVRKGAKHTPESIEKIKASHVGMEYKKRGPTPPHVREKIRNAAIGRTISPETRAKMSASLKGVPKTPEHVAAIMRAKFLKAAVEKLNMETTDEQLDIEISKLLHQ